MAPMLRSRERRSTSWLGEKALVFRIREGAPEMYAAFEEVCGRYALELRPFPAEALEIHPQGDLNRWNARQIVEHLVLTYKSSGSVLQQRLDKGRPTQARATIKQRIPQFVLLALGIMPSGRLSPASVTPAAAPGRSLDGAALADLLRSELQRLDELLVQCEKRFGKQQMATHQILGPLSAEQWRRFHVVHARHHLKQVKSIRNSELMKEVQVPVQD